MKNQNVVHNIASMAVIRPADPQGRLRIIGLPVGDPAAPMNALVKSIISATEVFLGKSRDLLTARIGADERMGRVRELAPWAKLQEAAAQIIRTRAQVEQEMSTLTYVQPHSQSTPFVDVMIDIELGKKLAVMDVSKKAALMFTMAADPLSNPRMVQAALRLPREVTEISLAQQENLRVSSAKYLMRGQYDSLDARREQCELATKAVALATNAVCEESADWGAPQRVAPAVAELALAEPLEWLPSGGDVVVGERLAQATVTA